MSKRLFIVALINLIVFQPTLLLAQNSYFEQATTNQQTKNQKDTKLTKSLGRSITIDDPDTTHTIEVSATGAIFQPGTFRLPILSRVSSAIEAAGGPLPEGSLRRVKIIRFRSKKDQTIDLDKFRLKGDVTQNPYLREGDTIYIGFKQKAVRILGPVRNQGEYDLVDEENYDSLIDFIGGYTTGFDPSGEFSVLRSANGKQVINRYKLEEIKRMPLANGDVILAPHLTRKEIRYDLLFRDLPGEVVQYPELEQRVLVIGGVKQPGGIDYFPHLTGKDYVALAGGFSTSAKRDNIYVIPKGSGKEIRYDAEKSFKPMPGDVIQVREQRIPPQFWFSFMATLASLGLSAVAIIGR